MSKHKRFAILTREAAAQQRRRDRPRPAATPTRQMTQGPVVAQASRLPDHPLSPTQRRSLVQRLGTVRGNRDLQSLLHRSGTANGTIAQRSRERPAAAVQPTSNVVQLGRRRRTKPTARTVFRVRNKHYSIRAKSLSGAVAAMTKQYGADEWGSCKWHPRPRFAFDKQTDTVIRMVINVRIVITMPRWASVSRRSQAVQKEWKSFYQALLTHEQGHEKLVRTHLGKLARSLIGKNREDAKSEYESALQALETASKAYDTRTKHGRTQGTIIDTTIK
jgi:predicted secreted Zn-dependent protease